MSSTVKIKKGKKKEKRKGVNYANIQNYTFDLLKEKKECEERSFDQASSYWAVP
jgi:hypothetical protein